MIAAVKAAEADDCQVVTAAMIGHKADIAFMALVADWRTLRHLQTALQHAGIDVVDSYVSITEVSEYAKGMPEEMLRGRLHPDHPARGPQRVLLLPDEQEARGPRQLVLDALRAAPRDDDGARSSGRKFAGKVAQVISGSTGLDDYEWGVTLFAKSPNVIKDVVYTMRFDKGSALYGEFGAFYVGYLEFIENII